MRSQYARTEHKPAGIHQSAWLKVVSLVGCTACLGEPGGFTVAAGCVAGGT
jgi:hypothetical protein